MNAPFPRPQAARPVRREEAPEHDARVLTNGGPEARIVLDGTPYVLRITRLGKLILTK
jgi:hemin uptake protein HemP